MLSWYQVARLGGLVGRICSFPLVRAQAGPLGSVVAAVLHFVACGMEKFMGLPSAVWTEIRASRSRCTSLWGPKHRGIISVAPPLSSMNIQSLQRSDEVTPSITLQRTRQVGQ